MARREIEKYREMNHERAGNRSSASSPNRFSGCAFSFPPGQAEGLKKLREARKDLARVKTLLREARIEEGVMANETAAAAGARRADARARRAAGTGWRGHQRQDGRRPSW